MPIQLKDKGGEDFSPVPAGAHQAICYGVVDLGTQQNKNSQYGPKRKLLLLFELPFERGDFGEGRENLPRAISATFTASLSSRAILRSTLESWRGRPFSEKELEGFDPKVLIGVNCQLNVVHEKRNDKTYANIKSIMPLAKGQTKMPMENPALYFSLDDQTDLAALKFPENMPDWIKQRIAFCDEVLAVVEGKGHGAPHHDDAPPDDVPQGDAADESVPF